VLPSHLLASTPLFAGLAADSLRVFDADAYRLELSAGDMLCRQGDAADAMYVVVRGSLHVLVEDANRIVRCVDTLGRGSVIGEMALLLNDTRTATVVAARGSELLRIPKAEFERLLLDHPTTAVEMARMLGARLKRTTRGEVRASRPRTMAFMPAAPGDDDVAGECARRLSAVLNEAGHRALHVTPGSIDVLLPGSADAAAGDPLGRALSSWMSQQEDGNQLVIYQAATTRPRWTERCASAADVVLVVARAGSQPTPGAGDAAPRRGLPSSRELVLVHDGAAPRTGSSAPWLSEGGFARHYHVRTGHDDDYRRLARFLTGTAVGLVLSGGGARGFAHIGVMKAMREHRMPIDLVGGASMGAIVGALLATGREPDEIKALASRAFVARQELDLTVPVVSLNTAAATVRRMKRLFGDANIEDLLVSYFCVSTNLSRAATVVHDRGPLWLWTRVSCSIPGLAPPVVHEGDLLVDGGLLNNLPADVMSTRCDGLIVGVDVTPDVDLRTDAPQQPSMSGWPPLWDRLRHRDRTRAFPTIVDILSRTALVGSVRDAARMQARCDVYLKPDLERFGMADFHAIDTLVDAGYHAAADWLSRAPRQDVRAHHA
jgi:predicted acylesterase/phospholipase RssA/CRP-like cAMP-binding protein